MNLWKIRQLAIEGKTLFLKILTISKVVHFALIQFNIMYKIAQLEKIQKQLIWKNGNLKLKYTALCKEYKKGGLKMWLFSPK